MYRLYYIDNTKKSYIKGLWIYNKKLYTDNVWIKYYNDKKALNSDIEKLFLKGEKAIFYSIQRGIYKDYDFTGFLKDNKGNVKALYNRLFLKRIKLSIKEIKSLLEKYNGLTIYKHINRFYIEIYY